MPTETLAPDALLENTGLSGSVTAIDEDPDSPDAEWLTTGTNTATACRTSFPTPSGSLTGTQTFRVRLRKTATNNGRTDDTWAIDLYQAGSQVAALNSGTNTPVDPGTSYTATWDATALGITDGTDIECRVTTTPENGGNPGGRGSIEVGAVAWDVQWETQQEQHSASTTIAVTASSNGSAQKHAGATAPMHVDAGADGPSAKLGQAAAPLDTALSVVGMATTSIELASATTISLSATVSNSSEKAGTTGGTLSGVLGVSGEAVKAGIADSALQADLNAASEAHKGGLTVVSVPLEASVGAEGVKSGATTASPAISTAISGLSGTQEQKTTSTGLGIAVSAASEGHKAVQSASGIDFTLQTGSKAVKGGLTAVEVDVIATVAAETTPGLFEEPPPGPSVLINPNEVEMWLVDVIPGVIPPLTDVSVQAVGNDYTIQSVN